MYRDDLKRRWDATVAACGCEAGAANEAYREVSAAYQEPHRAYHTLTHLRHFFGELDAIPLSDPAVEWATWYHDVIYLPGARDNEARSAELARERLHRMGVEEALIVRIEQLIHATRTHGPATDDIEALFLDADMSILGAEPDRYAQYAEAVRQEHRRIPAFLYRRGRKAFLRETLARPAIYLTEHFRDRVEQQARINMAAELETLTL